MGFARIGSRARILLAVLLVGVAGPAHAVVVTCQYAGRVTTSSDPHIPPGTPLGGTFFYDSTCPGVLVGGKLDHIFNSIYPHGLTYVVGPSWGYYQPGNRFEIDMSPAGHANTFGLGARTASGTWVSITLTANPNVFPANGALPTSLAFSGLAAARIAIGDGIQGDITSLTQVLGAPVPPTKGPPPPDEGPPPPDEGPAWPVAVPADPPATWPPAARPSFLSRLGAWRPFRRCR